MIHEGHEETRREKSKKPFPSFGFFPWCSFVSFVDDLFTPR
jgi:hypothetical protein